MKDHLNIHYDKKADFLELRIGKPTPAVYNDLGNDIFERVDEKTGEVKGFAIHNFRKRSEKVKDIEVSLPFDVKLISS